ncbi:MAG: DUF1273 domain-containing protein [Ruminococcaceae bacterium]|nr:DUF1273 domain-containing protein [Oscillospiraceae bacterium]
MGKIDLVCCLTGHRNIEAELAEALKDKLLEVIEILARDHNITFRAGGAMGFDTLAALCVLDKRKEHPDSIRLTLCLPCRNQTKGWDSDSVEIYRYIKDEADEVIVLHDEYTDGCMLERNRYMVDGADVCIAFCKDKNARRGGTAYTVRYAEKQGVKLINLTNLI